MPVIGQCYLAKSYRCIHPWTFIEAVLASRKESTVTGQVSVATH
ncbi:MAG: hypothetical protein ACM3PR_00230 [Bacteroidales bacterium]